jgi:hypothetical protein
MDKEQIQEFFKDEANKELFAEVAKAQGYESPTDIAALKDNRNDILKEKQILSDKFDTLQKTVDTLQSQAKKVNNDGKGKDAGSVDFESKFNELQDKFNKLDETHKKVSQNYSTTLKSSRISEALDAAGYKKHKPLLQQVLEASTTTKLNDKGGYDVLHGMDGYDVSIDEYMKSTFPTSKFGMEYKDVPENSGSNSQELNNSSGSSKTITKDQFDAMSSGERSTFFSTGGQMAKE